MKRIVLISCGSKKTQHRTKAMNLYVSSLFRFSLQYSQKLQADMTFILSAKHGLLPLNKMVTPYDITLNNMSSVDVKKWADRVLEQLKMVSNFSKDNFIFLAGNRYRKYLIPHLKFHEVPLDGLRIGEQLQKLKELTK